MQIKKDQVWECLISYGDWSKGKSYYSSKDGYLYNNFSSNERITDESFISSHFRLVDEPKEQQPTPSYYDNSKGSIYLFADNQKLNAWETDIIKRIVRCRKKGQWKEDLEKTKHLIDLYIKEYEKI